MNFVFNFFLSLFSCIRTVYRVSVLIDRFPTGQFYQHNGFPYCPTHYMQMQQMMMMQQQGGMQPGGM
jgi:hypothetical protein